MTFYELWYQSYFNTPQGQLGLEQERDEFCRFLWHLWSPSWKFTDAEYARTAASFENPDFVTTAIHSYRHRYANASGDPALDGLEARLAKQPKIGAPTVVLHGAEDQVEPPQTTDGKESHFTGPYQRTILPGVGHCLPAEAPMEVTRAIETLLAMILQVLSGREIILIIDETGDAKKGNTTDYVKRQYIGNLGKIENGIVAVTAYGLFEGMTFPLMFEVYKPKQRLLEEDVYQTKPEIAASMIKKLREIGFNFKLVLADSLYGESESLRHGFAERNFLSVLCELQLDFVVAIRSNHGVWLPQGQKIRYNRWRPYQRIFSDGKQEKRYIREIVFGKRHDIQYWQVTTDPETLPRNSTWFIMSKVPGIKYKEVGNLYGLRNWVEYGLKQSKNELGWADFRVTDYSQIQKWWEIVMSAYLMVSLHSQVLNNTAVTGINQPTDPVVKKFREHDWWDFSLGWKNILNNLRLIIQPYQFFNLIKPWLKVFPISHLSLGFLTLIALMNRMRGAVPDCYKYEDFLFSSA